MAEEPQKQNVVKLSITAYNDAKNITPLDDPKPMSVMINPESFNKKISISYSDKQEQGTIGKIPKFTKIQPNTVDFELLFDKTGVINDVKPGKEGVDEEINHMIDLTISYEGKKHRPRFIRLGWGNLKFEGCLQSMDISYKLFDPNGLPLRAVVKVSFVGVMEDVLEALTKNPSSPDLTHVRIVKDGDTLPLLAYEIYGDSKYYIEVANFNELNDFRNLVKGQRINFPPIVK